MKLEVNEVPTTRTLTTFLFGGPFTQDEYPPEFSPMHSLCTRERYYRDEHKKQSSVVEAMI